MRLGLFSLLALLGCASESSSTPGVTRDSGVPSVDDAVVDVAPPVDAAWVPPTDGAVRFVALNVHRLFDSTCDTGACASGDYEEVSSPSQIALRTERLAATFERLRADVVLVEEIETAPLLEAIADRMSGPRWSRVLGETGASASVDVGVMARFPITSVVRHRDRVLTRPDGTTTTFARELLEVHLEVRGKETVVFCAHFRSKANDDPGRRFAEAVGAREIVAEVTKAHPDALVLLGGDLNDVPGSPPLVALEEGGALTRVSRSLPESTIATFTFAGVPQAIDHFYAPTADMPRYVPGSFHAVFDPGARGLAGSDHAGIVADFSGF